MITISVSGAPASGKTTLSNTLLNQEKTQVIHMDYLMNRLKKGLPKSSVLTVYREQGDIYFYLNKEGLFYKFIHAKYINNIYEKIRESYIRRELKRLMHSAELKGIDYFIVEGVEAHTYSEICFFDYKILVYVDSIIRINRLRHRNERFGMTLNEDIINHEDRVVDDVDFVINNNSSIEDYSMQINLIGEIIKKSKGIVCRSRKKAQNCNKY